MSQIDRDLVSETQEEGLEGPPPVPEGWQREVRCPITGIWIVARRPGQHMVTSEEIYRMLREEEDLREEDVP